VTTQHTPCEADPDKWYIDRDGRKFDDEVLVTEADIRDLGGLPEGAPVEDIDAEAVIDGLVADRVKARLVERRHARDACFAECLVRTQCLQLALDNQEQYGIWGGYFPEQRRQLEREIEARKDRRRARELTLLED
jgi:hypothetical protein